MSLFSSFFAELLSALLRNAVGAKLAGKQMSFLQVCLVLPLLEKRVISASS